MKKKEKSPDTDDLLPDDKDKLPDHDKDNLPEKEEKKSSDGDESKESDKLDESSLDEVDDVAHDFINGLLDADKYIQEGKFIPNVKKIDLMGGKTSQLGGEFANFDIVAEKGIKGSVTDIDKIISPNSIDEIVCNNPYNPDISDPFELFIDKSNKILKEGGVLTINGQPQNGFIRKITIERLEQSGYQIIEFKTPLTGKYKNLTYGTTGGGNSIDPNRMVSIIIKKI